MFDLGWLELIVIGIVALIVVGPKDLPGMFRTVGRFMGKMRAMAREFQRSMEDAADQTGLKEATKGLNDIHGFAKSPGKSAADMASDFMKPDYKPPKTAAADAPKDADALEDEVAYAADADPKPAPKPDPKPAEGP